MAKWVNQAKLAWLKGVEAVGTTASKLASDAKLKATEMNLESRRREILTGFSLKAYELWQSGEALPKPLDEMLKELSELEEKLSVLRAQKYAAVGVVGEADVTVPAEEAPVAEEPAVEAPVAEEPAAEAQPVEATQEEAAAKAADEAAAPAQEEPFNSYYENHE